MDNDLRYYGLYSSISNHDKKQGYLSSGFEIVAEGLENPAMREVVLGIKGGNW